MVRSGSTPSTSPTSPNCRSRSSSSTRLPVAASTVARLVLTVVLPTPPLGPSTATSGASAAAGTVAAVGAVATRAIALCTASVTTGASAGSSTISCAPARRASARLPLAGPGMATISAISGRTFRLSARTSSTSSTPGLNISIAWLRSRSAAPTASPKSLRPDATCIPLPPLGTAPSSRFPGNDRCAATVSRTSLISAALAQNAVQEQVAVGAAKHAADVVDDGPHVVRAARRAEDEVDVALLLREHHMLDVVDVDRQRQHRVLGVGHRRGITGRRHAQHQGVLGDRLGDRDRLAALTGKAGRRIDRDDLEAGDDVDVIADLQPADEARTRRGREVDGPLVGLQVDGDAVGVGLDELVGRQLLTGVDVVACDEALELVGVGDGAVDERGLGHGRLAVHVRLDDLVPGGQLRDGLVGDQHG